MKCCVGVVQYKTARLQDLTGNATSCSFSLASKAEDLKSRVLPFQVALIIAVGFSVVSQNCRWFTCQWADPSAKVTFPFRRRWRLAAGRGGDSAPGVAPVPGARGRPWPPEGTRGAAEEPPWARPRCPSGAGQRQCSVCSCLSTAAACLWHYCRISPG